MRIHEILHSKGFDVITIAPEALVIDMLTLLKDNNLGAVVVSDDGRRIRGIVTERDVVRKLVDGPDFLDAPVSSIMSSDVLTCKPDDSVQSLMTTMTNRRIRHLPVIENDDVVGIISIGDLVKFQSQEQSFQIKYLTEYISGGR